MSTANVKLSSKEISSLKKLTGEKTGQKAVRKAIAYYLKEARQRRITRVLDNIVFHKNFNPLQLRHHER